MQCLSLSFLSFWAFVKLTQALFPGWRKNGPNNVLPMKTVNYALISCSVSSGEQAGNKHSANT